MTLAEFEPLTEAEKTVIAGLGTGHVTVLGDGTLPDPEAGDDRRVSARLIRWLALGAPGDDDVRLHEHGLPIKGALVVSDGQADPELGDESTSGLDLQGCRLDHDLVLLDCRFLDTPVLHGAKVQSLNLQGAHLSGLQADRLDAQDRMVLDGVQATGEVRLLGARIGGDLDCEGGRFENAGGRALSADGLDARGTVFLRGVQATGEVRLLGAQIGGDLDCDGGRFENAGGWALKADGAQVKGAFFWRPDDNGKRAEVNGELDLTAAEIGHICDDPVCWPGPGDLKLNRCRYGAFTGKGISALERIRWLNLQDPARVGKEFWPQPWEHCAHVLREMGHSEDARAVLIDKEDRQRAARRLKVIRGPFKSLGFQGGFGAALDMAMAALAWLLMPIFLVQYLILLVRDEVFSALIGYGHQPLRALWWLAVMWMLGTSLFGEAYGGGGFKPNNAVILSKPAWFECAAGGDRRGDHPSTLDCYRAQPEAAGYPAFNAALYSLDTLVPVVDLEVQDYWVPDERVSPAARTICGFISAWAGSSPCWGWPGSRG